jgi:DNA-binding transcriptional LysR family regulator
MNLRRVDLNLLVVIDALLAEGSVTAAARRLNMTQPAVSQALARARDLFGDPLLARSGRGLVMTPRAQALAPEIAALLARVAGLIGAAGFDPARSDRLFTLAAGDLAEPFLLPGLVTRMAAAAPRARLRLTWVRPDAGDGADAPDLMIHGLPPPGGAVDSVDLVSGRYVMLARHGHPALQGALDPTGFAALTQALVSPRGAGFTGPLDAALAALGLRRHVAVALARFADLTEVLAGTDLVAAVPDVFAARPEVQARCGSRPLPFEAPRFTLRLLWHRRHAADPAHAWFRGLVRAQFP